MKTAKIIKRVLHAMRIIGTALILISLVLSLYSVINTNSFWSKTTDKGERAYKTKPWEDFSNDMRAYDVDGVFMRLDFDARYFRALSAASRKSVELKQDGTKSQEETISALAETAKPYFADYYLQAEKNNDKNHRTREMEEVRDWFENKLNAAAFAEANSNVDEILEAHEIAEIVEYLESLYTPPPKLAKKGLKPPEQLTAFEGFYQELYDEHGEEAGTWFEFMCAVRTLAEQDLAAGVKISEAKNWYADSFDYEKYQAALNEVRSQEKNEEKENYLIGLIDLCEKKAAGESVDFRAFLGETYAKLQEKYPADTIAADEHVFLLAVKELTESLAPAETAGETETGEETAVSETASETESGEQAGGTAASVQQTGKKNQFDGSYAGIYSKMQTIKADLELNNPQHRQQVFATKIAEETQVRASIGSIVSVFWSVVSRYALMFLIGAGMVIVSVVGKYVLERILLQSQLKADTGAEGDRSGDVNSEKLSEEEKNALLRVSHLKQYFRSGSYINKAVDDISFYVKKGEVFGLVGESGCGKTTTGRTIINLYDPTEGDVYFEGVRISSNLNGYPVLRRSLRNEYRQACKTAKTNEEKLELKKKLKQQLSDAETNAMLSQIEKSKATHYYRENRKAKLTEEFERESKELQGEALEARTRRYHQDMKIAGKDNIMSKMQMIFQDPIASINPRMTVREIIAEGLVIQGVKDKDYINEKVNEMLEMVGLVREHADRYPHEFSGGQRQRIGIARAIIMNPDLIIADEPISALDVSIQAQVINLLNDLRNRMGLTIMFIAHNLSVVKYFSDRIAVMYYGNIVEMTTSDELFAHPLHPYTKSLLSAIPYPDPHYEKTRKRIEYNPAEAHDYSVDKPTLREIVPGHFICCNDAEFAAYQEELAR